MTVLTIAAPFFSSSAPGSGTLTPVGVGSYWSGASPYLDHPDEATAFGHYETDGSGFWIGASFEARNPGPVRSITVSAQVRPAAAEDIDLIVQGRALGGLPQGFLEFYTGGNLPAGVWSTVSWTVRTGEASPSGDFLDGAALRTESAGGHLEALVNFGNKSFDVSWISVDMGGAPHQVFQRGDSLGAGGGLVFGPSTRQSSGLVFGTH